MVEVLDAAASARECVHIGLLGIKLSYSWQQRKQKYKQSKDRRDKCDREKPN